jgi:hypothetical protein
LKKQGVAATFAKAYANIVFKNRLAKTIKSAIEWLSQRCKTVNTRKVNTILDILINKNNK